MERGIRTACAAVNLNNPQTIAAVDNSRFSQGCYTIELARVGADRRFCNERDIFEYLVSNYCDSRLDGVLPSTMGSVEYPPDSWVQFSYIIASIGAMLLLLALFFPRRCKNAGANEEGYAI